MSFYFLSRTKLPSEMGEHPFLLEWNAFQMEGRISVNRVDLSLQNNVLFTS